MSITNKALDFFIGKSEAGYTNFSNRDRWLRQVLSQIPAGSRILDAGAGEQQYKKYCTHLNYVSQDFAQYNPEAVSVGLQMEKWDYGKLDIVSDIAAIPEPDSSFDAIMCTEVFEHIINPRDAIREFFRLLKPGGTLIITAPFCSMTHFAPYHFYTGFNRFFYETEFAAIGFTIVDLVSNGNYFEYLAQEMNHLPFFADKYAGTQFSRKERIAHRIIQKLLEKLSKKDSGSNELLCFGLHVVAKKN